MEKVKEFLKKIPDWVKAVVASAMIIAVAVVVNDVVTTNISRNISEIGKDFFYNVVQIDSIEEEKGKLKLIGWVFALNENSQKEDFDIVLYDYIGDKKYYPKMKDIAREDVNEYFLCEYNYINSGFEATISSKKLDLENVNYEVLIKRTDKRDAIATGIYISKGVLTYTKPENYIPLNVKDTRLEDIVNLGTLRVYKPDVGMYVYQYENTLYWIADKNYAFETDESTYIQYQLWTTQNEKLPQERIENSWFFDNIGFVFENNEIEPCGEYRVAVSRIPTEYSVRQIETGYYVGGEWIWRSHFRPRYEFN